MSYSSKQILFATFMLNRIGFVNHKDIDIYLNHLERLYGGMVNYQSNSYKNGYVLRYSVSECIDRLKQEIDIKNSKYLIKKVEPKKQYSATDLASYDYCPAQFVISNSFLIENPNGAEAMEAGQKFHEKLLAARTKWQLSDGINYSSKEIDARFMKESRLVFAGHSENDSKFKNGDWVGIPDYIFKDSEDKYFVVEEKFHKQRDPQKLSESERSNYYNDEIEIDMEAETLRESWADSDVHFFSNHIVQLMSYIKNIKKYPVEYGYLLYWYYDSNQEGELYIHKFAAKKIIINESNEKLYFSAEDGIKKLRESKQMIFSTEKANMKKCVGCNVNKYCGHKTKRFTSLNYPYDIQYLNLYFAKFPEELKKQ
jgi:CRISPR/Cas system-associated exonuclease Cas4 (RecB family)